MPDAAYNGYLYDNEETPVGTIQAKVAKARLNRKTWQLSASVTVAILIAGEKKISLRGTLDVESGALVLKAKDGRFLDLQLGANGLSGIFGDYVIDGARDVFSSKATDDKTRANAALAQWKGALAIASDVGTFSVTISAKGKARVTGVLADGTKTGRVVLDKSGEVDEAKAGVNPSALRFSYRTKDGTFTGTFKAYVLYRGKPKATTVTVSGVVIDGVGYGTATIRKMGSVPIRIE